MWFCPFTHPYALLRSAVSRHGLPQFVLFLGIHGRGTCLRLTSGSATGVGGVSCTFFLSPPCLRIPGFKFFYVAYLWINFSLTWMLWWKHELGFGLFTLQVLSQIGCVMGAGEMTESTNCSRGLHWCSQPPVTPVLGSDALFWCLWALHPCGAQTYTCKQNT